MKDERVEAFKVMVIILVLIFGALIWLVLHTDKPLSPKELWKLEEVDKGRLSEKN